MSGASVRRWKTCPSLNFEGGRFAHPLAAEVAEVRQSSTFAGFGKHFGDYAKKGEKPDREARLEALGSELGFKQ